MIHPSKHASSSGHLEIILAIVIAIMGALWFFQSASSAKNRYQAPASAYYPSSQYASAESPANAAANSGKINTRLLFIAGGLIFVIGVMTGLFFPLLHSMKHKHHKVPFSFSSFLPTKTNRVMNFLDCLQKLRDAGLITKHEYESKRLEFLSKL